MTGASAGSGRLAVGLAVAGVMLSLALEVWLARLLHAPALRGTVLTALLVGQCAAVASLGSGRARRRALWLVVGTVFLLPYVLVILADARWRFR